MSDFKCSCGVEIDSKGAHFFMCPECGLVWNKAPGIWSDRSAVQSLSADNARLRGLIKKVETSGNPQSSGECPWCWNDGSARKRHAVCDAFTPDGVVK